MRWILLLAISLIYPTVSGAFACQRRNNHQQQCAVPDDSERTAPKRKNLTWEASYQLLCEYKDIHGNCNVPQSQKPLGPFVNRQRIEYTRLKDPNCNKATAMTTERQELLEEIGFVWDIVEHTWNARYQELCQFRKENGHSVVPRSHGPLGAWVEKQRIEYKKYKALHKEDSEMATDSDGERPSTTLTKERIQRLDRVGFVYDVREKQFEENVGTLRFFRETVSSCCTVSIYGFGFCILHFMLILIHRKGT